jgi:hypothetical protein
MHRSETGFLGFQLSGANCPPASFRAWALAGLYIHTFELPNSLTINNLTFSVTPDRLFPGSWPHSTVMPLIEELPTTNTTRISHGWAYVPDTGPAKAILPPGGRKRGAARDGVANRADGSAKHAKILQARLADLDKENYKDTTIPIPPRAKEKSSSRAVIPGLESLLFTCC